MDKLWDFTQVKSEGINVYNKLSVNDKLILYSLKKENEQNPNFKVVKYIKNAYYIPTIFRFITNNLYLETYFQFAIVGVLNKKHKFMYTYYSMKSERYNLILQLDTNVFLSILEMKEDPLKKRRNEDIPLMNINLFCPENKNYEFKNGPEEILKEFRDSLSVSCGCENIDIFDPKTKFNFKTFTTLKVKPFDNVEIPYTLKKSPKMTQKKPQKNTNTKMVVAHPGYYWYIEITKKFVIVLFIEFTNKIQIYIYTNGLQNDITLSYPNSSTSIKKGHSTAEEFTETWSKVYNVLTEFFNRENFKQDLVTIYLSSQDRRKLSDPDEILKYMIPKLEKRPNLIIEKN